MPPRFTNVEAPTGPRYDAALDELLDAVADAPKRGGDASLTVVVRGRTVDLGETETYRLTGDAAALRIEAPTEAGAVRGIYDLAAAVREERSVTAHVGETVTSRLPFRMIDLGAVGVAANPDEWRPGTDYSHISGAFQDTYLADAPYIDEAALTQDYADWTAFLEHSLALGYNAVAWPGFLEYVTFADADVYPEGDPHIARAEAMREAFTPFWNRAAELGVKVYLRTDMLSLTPALQSYFEERFGSADTTNPELWQVYADGLDELYAAAPALSGILIRIGEAGSIYEMPGWDYYSALAVRTVDAVRAMLQTFTAQAEASDREVIFRTWSVGIGAVGDMHTDAASYAEVLDGIDSPSLIVSTKYTLGDFYSWLPLNDTLESGDQRRIVEFQSRREFEALRGVPERSRRGVPVGDADAAREEPAHRGRVDVGAGRRAMACGADDPVPQGRVLAAFRAQHGGGGGDRPRSRGGCRCAHRRLGADLVLRRPADGARASPMRMALSRAAPSSRGCYLQAFAERRVFALGLEPPPAMWIFEWDILTGDAATLDVMYSIVKDDLTATIAQERMPSRRPSDRRRGSQGRMSRRGVTRSCTTRSSTRWTTRSTRCGCSSYRAMFLRQAEWHDTLSASAYAAWEPARDEYVALAAEHLDRFEGDVDHPAWNLEAAQLGIDRADRDLLMSWLARVLLVLALAWIVIGMLSARTRLVRRPGAAAARASWLGSILPWRARESTLGMLPLDRWLMVLVPGALLVATRAVQTSFLAPVQLAVTLGAWAVFVAVLMLLLRGRSPWAAVIAAVGGVVVLRRAS